MITSIIKFQLKERLTHWISLVFFLMLIFQGVWYTKGTFDYYVNDGVLMNAPSIFYKNFAGLGMLMVIMIVILTGSFFYKDIQYKTANWVYTLPVNEKKFFIGRYLAAFCVNVILATGYFFGMLLVPYSGIGEAHRFGAAPIGQMLHGMTVFLVPNLLLFNSIIICVLVYTKRMNVAYLAAFLVVVFFLLMQTTAESSGYSPLLLIADPNGYVTISEYLDKLSTFDKNHAYVQLSGYLLINRLMWLGVSVILTVLAYRKFSFKDFIRAGNKKEKSIRDTVSPNFMNWTSKIPVPRLSFTLSDQLKKTLTLSSLEFNNIVRPSSFRIIIGVLVLMIVLQNLLWNAGYYIGPEMPLTSGMTFFRLAWGVIITLLLMIWAGELFFKDKTINIWQITDALPVPVWVSQLSRLLAMCGVALILCLVFILVGVISQIALGGMEQIDLGLYISDVLGYKWGWLTFVLQICFVFFIAGLTCSRYTTHIISVGIFLITIISFDMGLFEQVRFGYPLVPGMEDYSEISGYGIWATAGFWLFIMWASLAVVFVMLGILFWDRGYPRSWFRKLQFSGKQLNSYAKLAVIVFLGIFLALQYYISAQAYSNGNFKSSSQEDFEAADYEKKYKHLEELAQPRYQKVDLELAFYPEERKATYKAIITLKNPSSETIDVLYLNFKDFVKLTDLKFDNQSLKEVSKDELHHLITYHLPNPLSGGEVVTLQLEAEKQYVGFSPSGENPQADLMFNGSFGSIREFLPVIGYDDSRELDENRKRTDEGLTKLLSRMPVLDDLSAQNEDAYAKDAFWVAGKITLSTSSDQMCIAPGKLTEQWKEHDRNYYQFEVKDPAPFNWHIGSAKYVVQLEGQAKSVSYRILGDVRHSFNTGIYEDAIRQGIEYVQENLGKYPYDELRLTEINRYHDARYAYPNMIAISEKEGWVADTKALKEKSYLYLTVVSELSKQWINKHIHIANVQGADMLKVALPEAIALHFVEKSLGQEAADLLVEKKLEIYGKDHNNEPNQEPPLLYADGIDYLEVNKGAVALYQMMKGLEPNLFYSVLKSWDQKEGDGNRTFKSLYEQLLSSLPTENRESIRVQFEEVN
ncbi:ABC-type transport system involved in multi-copper enzyme maturation permease subunit [Algoriphagus sp. 4150]|uniref:hypothetical protein n=1 Tax=Algoriphagus sp. 4150 TaxID=2817756 RepID=UPI00285A46C7|nr:hypothetical protein [Algoriphagus sp. 4150]MDR7131244.1 ABC-type transport system involved in multi-copper enzyme maturation permease subunit [Algoriphagus sp. 4150]